MNNCCYDCQMINLGILLIDTIKNRYSEPKHINTECHKECAIEELKCSIKSLTQMVEDRDYIIEELNRQIVECHKHINTEPKVPDVSDTLLKEMMEKAVKHSMNSECKTVKWVIGSDYFIRDGKRFMINNGKLYKEIKEEA